MNIIAMIPKEPIFTHKILAELLTIKVASLRAEPTIGINPDINFSSLPAKLSIEFPMIF